MKSGHITQSLAVLLCLAFVGCSSQPALSPHEIQRIHTVKVVYLPLKYDLGVYAFDTNNTRFAAALGPQFGFIGGFVGSLMDSAVASGKDQNGSDKTSQSIGRFHDEVSKLDTRQRLYAIATRVVASVPWLKGTQIEMADPPFANNYMWQYIKDSGVDAIIYLVPIAALDDSGHFLHLQISAVVYANPHDASPYLYDSASFGEVTKLVIPNQDPKKAPKSIYALAPDECFSLWFADGAKQLYGDFDSTLPEIDTGLAHYLGVAAPATPAQGGRGH